MTLISPSFSKNHFISRSNSKFLAWLKQVLVRILFTKSVFLRVAFVKSVSVKLALQKLVPLLHTAAKLQSLSYRVRILLISFATISGCSNIAKCPQLGISITLFPQHSNNG